MALYEFTWSWTPEDHVVAHKATLRHAVPSVSSRLERFGAPTLLALFGLAALLNVLNGHSGALLSLLPWGVILVLWLYFLRSWAPRLMARSVARNDPSVKGVIHHRIAEDGLHIRTDVAAVTLTWSHILQVVETPEQFLYYYAPRTAYYTPRRAIPEGTLEGLRDSLRRLIGSRAHLATGPAPTFPGGP